MDHLAFSGVTGMVTFFMYFYWVTCLVLPLQINVYVFEHPVTAESAFREN
jgi:hypothetical protein